MLRVEEVSDASRLACYREQWDALVARSPDASMFDTYEWLTSWIKAFWDLRTICFLFFWNGGELLGVAPLLTDKKGDVWCSASLVCPVNLHGNRASVICAENPKVVFEALFAHLQQNHKHVRLAFRNVLNSTPVSMDLPAAAAEAGMSTLVFPSVSSPIIRVSGDWPSYLKTQSSHLSKEVKRKVKQFQNSGCAEVKVITDPEQCTQAMQDIVQIEKRSWKEEQRVSLSCVPSSQRLYEHFANAATAKGLLKSYIMYLDSEPVVYVYGVSFRDEYYALRTSFDSEYKKLSPGVVLFDRILRDAFEEGKKIIDFGPGEDSRWKHDFSNDVRTQVNVCMFSPWSVRCHCCGMFQHRVKPILKKHAPILVKLKNQIHPKV